MPTERRASRAADGSVRHHAEPEYHGNPVDPQGSLVTWHFGYDLAARILERTRMPTVSGGREPGCPGPPAQIRTCALTHTAPTSGG